MKTRAGFVSNSSSSSFVVVCDKNTLDEKFVIKIEVDLRSLFKTVIMNKSELKKSLPDLEEFGVATYDAVSDAVAEGKTVVIGEVNGEIVNDDLHLSESVVEALLKSRGNVVFFGRLD